PDQLYSGAMTLSVDAHLVDEFYQSKRLAYKDASTLFKPNQYLILKDSVNPNHTAMGRYSRELDVIVPIFKPVEGLWGIFPKNAEQAFAIDALLNDDIKLVSLV